MKKILAEIQALERKLAIKGPRGGEIIGKTKSGKPIYDSHDHPSHKNFTKQDHQDAADLHDDAIADAYNAPYTKATEKQHNDKIQHHKLNYAKHSQSAGASFDDGPVKPGEAYAVPHK